MRLNLVLWRPSPSCSLVDTGLILPPRPALYLYLYLDLDLDLDQAMKDGEEIRIDGPHQGPDGEHADPARLDDDLEAKYLDALRTNEAIEEEIGPGVELAEWPEPDRVEVDVVEATTVDSQGPRVTTRQVIEAVLFVGGRPLTAKKLSTLVGPDAAKEVVEEEIQTLNALYSREARPYEIRLEEGGYRLQLRPEFEPLRNRVFGLGPKDVKLSQEALEVLAMVAYEQPISRVQIEEKGRSNASGMLRQLLRRELIQIERGKNPRRDITYRTTSRFLSLFGLASLVDLPTPQELEVR